MTASGSGDEVIALGGTYALTTFVTVDDGETLSGAEGSRPVIEATGNALSADGAVANFATIRHLEFRGTGLFLRWAVGSDLVVSRSNSFTSGVTMVGANTQLRDSLVVLSGEQSDAVRAQSTEGDAALIRNVTAIATGTGSDGIEVHGSSTKHPMDTGCESNSAAAALENVIARGTSADLRADTDEECPSANAAITVSYSNFANPVESGTGNSSITQGVGNQTTSPQTDDAAIFADTTLYHQKEAAPTHNAGGAGSGDAGFVDPDGHPRIGEGHVDIGSDELPELPGVVTGGASGVAATSADVTGAVDGHGEGIVYRFEYGKTPALGAMTAEQTTSSSSLTSIQQTLTGLPAQTTIYYRARARLDGPQSRVAVGDTKSFTTLPQFAPVVTTQPATGLGATFAMLHGLVNPMDHATTWRFDWGETTAYGSSTAPADAGAGTGAVPVSDEIDGLKPHTTYHYRVEGTSQIATALGSDATFTTKRLKVRRLRVKPKRFRTGSDLPQVAKVGSVIRFKLNGDAKVKLKFLRIKNGRLVPKGGFKYKAEAGKQKIRFEGRLSRKKKLKPGKYKLVVRAKTEGVKSKKAKAKFRLLPKR